MAYRSITKQWLLFYSTVHNNTIIIVSLGITPTTLSTVATLEITAVMTSIIAFVVGGLAGVLLYHCISRYRSQLKAVLPSHQRQREDPEYDYVTNGTENNPREKVACDPVQRIELKANVAYKPVEH